MSYLNPGLAPLIRRWVVTFLFFLSFNVTVQANDPVQVFDINVVSSSISENLSPRDFVRYKNQILFTGYAQPVGRELWSYDIESKEISLLADVLPGEESADAEKLIVVEDNLYFFADIMSNFYGEPIKEFWQLNLINGELTTLTDIKVTIDAESGVIHSPVKTPVYFDNQLFLNVEDEAYRFVEGSERLRLDLNTMEIHDSVIPQKPVVFDDRLFFNLDSRLFHMDDEGHITRVTGPSIGKIPSDNDGLKWNYLVDEKLFVLAPQASLGYLIYDDVSNELRSVEHFYPAVNNNNFSYFLPMIADAEALYFFAESVSGEKGIWLFNKANGLTERVEAVEQFIDLQFPLVQHSNDLYYYDFIQRELRQFSSANQTSQHIGYLSAEPILVTDEEVFFAGSDLQVDKIEHFDASEDTLWGVELSDLSSSSRSNMVQATLSSFPSELTPVDNENLFFKALGKEQGFRTDDTPTLWQLNTIRGEFSEIELPANPDGLRVPIDLRSLDNNLYYVYSDANGINQIWRRDSNPGPSEKVTFFPELHESGLSHRFIRPELLTEAEGALYFVFNIRTENYSQLWKYNPENNETEQVARFPRRVSKMLYEDDMFLLVGTEGAGDTVWSFDVLTDEEFVITRERQHLGIINSKIARSGTKSYMSGDVYNPQTRTQAFTIFEVDFDDNSIKRIFSPGDINTEIPSDIHITDKALFFSTYLLNDGARHLWKYDFSTENVEQVADMGDDNFVVDGNYLYFRDVSGSLHYLNLGTLNSGQIRTEPLSDSVIDFNVHTPNRIMTSFSQNEDMHIVGNKLYTKAFAQTQDEYQGLELVAVDLWLPPVIHFAASTQVGEGQVIRLDASESFDYYDRALQFKWEQISGPLVDIPEQQGAIIELDAPDVTDNDEIEFALTVMNDRMQVSQSFTVPVTPVATAPSQPEQPNQPDQSSGSSGGGSLFYILYVLSTVLVFRAINNGTKRKML